MAIVRTLGGFELADYTDEINKIPNMWNLIGGELGLFREEVKSVYSVEFDDRDESLTLIEANKLDTEKVEWNEQDFSNLHSVVIPHFQKADSIKPRDIRGIRRHGTPMDFETVDSVRADKMIRIQRSWDATMEYARMQAIMGNVYAPTAPTNVTNWYTEFGVTRKETNHNLADPAFDILAAIEEEVAHIQDNVLTGGNVSGVICLASPEYFQQLISSDQIEEYYKDYSTSAQAQPLRDRLAMDGNNSRTRFRKFEFQGVVFYEYRGSFADRNGVQQRLIPANEAYYLPMGVEDMFLTYFAPANFLDSLNIPAQRSYFFEWMNKGKNIHIHTESNFLNMVRRPQAVTQATFVP